jgi:oxalate decarboxylase/phosphoglucose isomerase-like protein (cupin superfamily)
MTITVKADKTGKKDAGPAIWAALKKAKPGDVVYIPRGRYRIAS